jgi:hypothetical protein
MAEGSAGTVPACGKGKGALIEAKAARFPFRVPRLRLVN